MKESLYVFMHHGMSYTVWATTAGEARQRFVVRYGFVPSGR